MCSHHPCLKVGRTSSCYCACYLCIAQDCAPAPNCNTIVTPQNPPAGTSFRTAVQQLASTLKRVDTFYNSIGGLLGYHRKCLQIMMEKSDQQTAVLGQSAGEVTFHMPQGPDLAGPQGRQLAAESAAAGLEALAHMAEIYPLGGMVPLHTKVQSRYHMALCPPSYVALPHRLSAVLGRRTAWLGKLSAGFHSIFRSH